MNVSYLTINLLWSMSKELNNTQRFFEISLAFLKKCLLYVPIYFTSLKSKCVTLEEVIWKFYHLSKAAVKFICRDGLGSRICVISYFCHCLQNSC